MSQAGIHSADSGTDRVYLEFYRLKEAPFSLTPNPEFLFSSQTHQQVIDKIQYGIQSRMGFILLIGEVGTGKTTICRAILDNMGDTAETVYIINPSLSGTELISSILDDLNIPHSLSATKKELIDALNQFLLTAERRRPVVIIIDDAQTMHVDALEDMRFLSNLETDKNKLLQVVLVGQPELSEVISRPEMRQLQQRVAVNCFLNYLIKEEVESYISRRLFVAGDKGRISFTSDAIKLIYKASGGIPRLINKICDYTLTAGYVVNAFTLTAEHVKLALEELGELRPGSKAIGAAAGRPRMASSPWRWPLLVILSTPIILCAGFYYYAQKSLSEARVPRVFSSGGTDPFEAGDNIGNEMAVPPASLPGPSSSRPYSLQLGSYVSLELATRAVSYYGGKGIDSNWQATDFGPNRLGFRLISGRFKTKEAALAYKEAKGLEQAVVLYAPWTIQVGDNGSQSDIERIREQLRDKRLDAQMVGSPDGTFRLFCGVFASEQGTQKVIADFQRLGIVAKAVQR